MATAQRFDVTIGHRHFPDALGDVQIVYHGINKSGSMAMSNAIGEAYKWAGRESEFLSHYRIPGSDQDFQARVDGMHGQRAFIVDHYLFGALKPTPQRIWVTQFRHPLPRILSFYQWLKNKHEAEHGTTEGYPSIIEFTRASHGTRHSQIAQFGSGFGPNRNLRNRHVAARDMFHISVDAIEANIYAIGIAEYFEESIMVFAGLAGLASVAPWVRDNRNKGRPLADEITAEERSVIEEVYEYDFALYEYALARFQKQNEAFGAALTDGLEPYRAACIGQYKDRLVG